MNAAFPVKTPSAEDARDATSLRPGLTILIVEQNARATLALADRAYLLEAGRITGSGPAETLRTDPAVVRAFLGGAAVAGE